MSTDNTVDNNNINNMNNHNGLVVIEDTDGNALTFLPYEVDEEANQGIISVDLKILVALPTVLDMDSWLRLSPSMELESRDNTEMIVHLSEKLKLILTKDDVDRIVSCFNQS